MSYHRHSFPSDPEVLSVFRHELARTAAMHGPVDAGPLVWPRFVGYYESLARLPRRLRRALQRRWRRSIGGLALLLALGQAPALAATLNVGVGCTLVDAITAANDDTPTGGCPAGSGLDTITLPAGSTQTLTSDNEQFRGRNGLPVIRSAIVIAGNGSTIARDPNGVGFRLFAIASTGSLTLQETTVTGGVSTAISAYVVSGGGILNYGTLVLTNSTVSGNVAGADGGGVYNSGSLTLTNSTVSGNSANDDGGGVFQVFSGSATVSNSTLVNSTVSGNSSGNRGGGVNIRNGTVTLTNSTISGNSGTLGGGVYNDSGGTLTLVQTLVSGNSASLEGSEVYNYTRDNYGTVNADDFNLFGHDGSSGVKGFTPGVTDIVPSVPLAAVLDPTLADNGGATGTHALIAGSPAIDAAPAASCTTTTDQRGLPRPQDGDGNTVAACDIGAFELPPPLPLPPPPPPPPPPSASDADTEPLMLSNPRPFGCEFVDGVVTCVETGGTPPFIIFDVDIPVDAFFLQFEFTFTGGDAQVRGAEQADTPGRFAGRAGPRGATGDLGAVFISNVPIAALPASAVQGSGQFPLTMKGTTTMTIANYPSGAAGSVFRVRNIRVDRCRQVCSESRATICGTEGPDDQLMGTPGNDVIVGRGGDDIIRGGGGNDLICGGTGSDELRGDEGADRLCGDEGNDMLLGGTGRDELRGDEGNDRLRGDEGTDALFGGPGRDVLLGGEGNDTLRGDVGKDRLVGGKGRDVLRGGEGNDTLLGGPGDDRLNGGLGRDTCDGGSGNDTGPRCESRSGIP